jgi:hypothetical protein
MELMTLSAEAKTELLKASPGSGVGYFSRRSVPHGASVYVPTTVDDASAEQPYVRLQLLVVLVWPDETT